LMVQSSGSQAKVRTQSPVSSQMPLGAGKEAGVKHGARSEARPGGPVVSTSMEGGAGPGGLGRPGDLASVSPSSSSQPSPDQQVL